jgi:hypothetical protein
LDGAAVNLAAVYDNLAHASLESLLTSPLAFGLTTASPLQRAACRIIDGEDLAELAEHPDVLSAIGRVPPGLCAPLEVVLLSAIRCAKSLLAAAAAVRLSQRVDISALRQGEVARISIVSLDKDKAGVVFDDHLLASLRRSPLLRLLLVGEPTADSLYLRHPSGAPIEVSVRAGKRAGGDLVSRWSAGVIFDEAPRMMGSSDGVVNLDDARKSVLGRLLPGAALLYPGSPWAPFGPVYEMVQEHEGRPSAECAIVRGTGPQMNPVWWTPTRCEELRANDADAYATDVEARFLSPEENLFADTLLQSCARKDETDLPYNPRAAYWAAMDPATRGNAWTLVIATRVGRKRVIACVRQWIGSSAAPLSPKTVLRDIAHVLYSYGLDAVQSDQYYVDANRDLARDMTTEDGPKGKPMPVRIIQSSLTEQEKAAAYLDMRAKMAEGQIELHGDRVFLEDLRRAKRRVTQRGITIDLPTTQDGRHCDYAPATMLVCERPLDDVKAPLARPDDPETAKMRAQHFARMQQAQGRRGAA